MEELKMDFVDWINYGIDMGWCTQIHCETHDGPILTEDEQKEWEQWEDVCYPVVRIW